MPSLLLTHIFKLPAAIKTSVQSHALLLHKLWAAFPEGKRQMGCLLFLTSARCCGCWATLIIRETLTKEKTTSSAQRQKTWCGKAPGVLQEVFIKWKTISKWYSIRCKGWLICIHLHNQAKSRLMSEELDEYQAAPTSSSRSFLCTVLSIFQIPVFWFTGGLTRSRPNSYHYSVEQNLLHLLPFAPFFSLSKLTGVFWLLIFVFYLKMILWIAV